MRSKIDDIIVNSLGESYVSKLGINLKNNASRTSVYANALNAKDFMISMENYNLKNTINNIILVAGKEDGTNSDKDKVSKNIIVKAVEKVLELLKKFVKWIGGLFKSKANKDMSNKIKVNSDNIKTVQKTSPEKRKPISFDTKAIISTEKCKKTLLAVTAVLSEFFDEKLKHLDAILLADKSSNKPYNRFIEYITELSKIRKDIQDLTINYVGLEEDGGLADRYIKCTNLIEVIEERLTNDIDPKIKQITARMEEIKKNFDLMYKKNNVNNQYLTDISAEIVDVLNSYAIIPNMVMQLKRALANGVMYDFTSNKETKEESAE